MRNVSDCSHLHLYGFLLSVVVQLVCWCLVDVVHIGEEALVVPAARLVRADVAEEAVKVVAVAALWTAPLTGMVFERQLFAGSQTLAVVVVAVPFLVAFTGQMIRVADFLVIGSFQQTIEGSPVCSGQFCIDALLMNVEQDKLWWWLLLGCHIDNGGIAALFTDCGP